MITFRIRVDEVDWDGGAAWNFHAFAIDGLAVTGVEARDATGGFKQEPLGLYESDPTLRLLRWSGAGPHPQALRVTVQLDEGAFADRVRAETKEATRKAQEAAEAATRLERSRIRWTGGTALAGVGATILAATLTYKSATRQTDAQVAIAVTSAKAAASACSPCSPPPSGANSAAQTPSPPAAQPATGCARQDFLAVRALTGLGSQQRVRIMAEVDGVSYAFPAHQLWESPERITTRFPLATHCAPNSSYRVKFTVFLQGSRTGQGSAAQQVVDMGVAQEEAIVIANRASADGRPTSFHVTHNGTTSWEANVLFDLESAPCVVH